MKLDLRIIFRVMVNQRFKFQNKIISGLIPKELSFGGNVTENWYPSQMDFDIDDCVASCQEAIKRVWKSAYGEGESVDKTKMLKQKFKELCEPRKNRSSPM